MKKVLEKVLGWSKYGKEFVGHHSLNFIPVIGDVLFK
jgi:hypothetical protein